MEKRRRAPRHSACERCKSAHRVCDGKRPCKRCVLRGKADLCQTPPKRPKLPQQQQAFYVVKPLSTNAPQGCASIFHQADLANSFPPFPPHIEQEDNPDNNAHQPILLSLLQQIRDLNETTNSLLATHHTITNQVSDLKSRRNATQTSPISGIAQMELVQEDSFHASQYLLTQVEEEINELTEIDHDPSLSLVPVASTSSKDVDRFKESQFLPFVIEDASTPFFVFGLQIDWGMMTCMRALGTEMHGMYKAFKCFTASPSFLTLTKYSEEELTSNMKDLFPKKKTLVPQEMETFIRDLFPQPGVHVSTPNTSHPRLRLKDGSYIATEARGQCFYSDGHVSFIICSVLSATPISVDDLRPLCKTIWPWSIDAIPEPGIPGEGIGSDPIYNKENEGWLSPGRDSNPASPPPVSYSNYVWPSELTEDCDM